MFRIILVLMMLFPLFVMAHSGGHPVRFVAQSGVDKGDCENIQTPCASIAYAVDKSQKGDQIRVAAGRYRVNELDVFYLLSEMVKITGGYSIESGFKKYNAKKNITTIEGIPAEYRDKLAKRGFRLLQDRKALDGTLRVKEAKWLQQYKSLTSKPSGPLECSGGSAENNDCHNIDRVAHFPLTEFSSNPQGANDIWGFVDLNNSREYALIGLTNGTSVVDVTNAENPVQVGHVAGKNSTWRDVKVYQYFDNTTGLYKAYAYVTTETAQGLQILDLTDLPNAVTLGATLEADFVTAHNVTISNVDYASGLAFENMNAYLYISGSDVNGGAFLAFSLEDPLNPKRVSNGTLGYVHDATTLVIDDNRISTCATGHNPCELLIDFNESTVDIWDVTNKAAPFNISSTPYPQSGYTHSGWWSEDKMTIFIQDELDERNFGLNTTMHALDISDLKNPVMAGTFRGTTQAIDHNGFTVGNYYYMSNYRRGLTVIDVSDPANMREVGFFDTFAVPVENSANFNGAWGAYPFLPSGNILVSDIEYGLWVLKLNENDGDLPVPIIGASSSSASAIARSSAPSVSNGSGGGSLPLLALFILCFASFLKRKVHSH